MKTESVEGAIKVLVSGYLGKMGAQVVKAVQAAPDLVLVGGFDPLKKEEDRVLPPTACALATLATAPLPTFTNLDAALEATLPDVMVDFSQPHAAAQNIEAALSRGVSCVLGTTGVTTETLELLAKNAQGQAALFYAPNFTTGAVLMMAASKLAAHFFEDVEIIEFHHNNKKDAPSGTALATAEIIAKERSLYSVVSAAPGPETELPGFKGARGAELSEASGIRLHSVRSNGYVASQEVLFGSPGQTLSIRHDSFDRSAYMPGVLLGIRKVGTLSGLVIGLEELMQL